MPTVTLSELQQRVYDRLDNNTLLYTAGEVTNAINECIRVVNLAVGFLQITDSVGTGVTIANQVYYSTPASILIPMRVQFEGSYLQKVFPNQIGKSNATWVTDTTTTTGQEVSEWIPIGLTTFAIHPADALGGGALQMTGIAEPVPLVNPNDNVSIPGEYTDTIVDLGAQVLSLKESAAQFRTMAAYYQLYLSLIKKATIWRGASMPRFWIPEAVQKD